MDQSLWLGPKGPIDGAQGYSVQQELEKSGQKAISFVQNDPQRIKRTKILSIFVTFFLISQMKGKK